MNTIRKFNDWTHTPMGLFIGVILSVFGIALGLYIGTPIWLCFAAVNAVMVVRDTHRLLTP